MPMNSVSDMFKSFGVHALTFHKCVCAKNNIINVTPKLYDSSPASIHSSKLMFSLPNFPYSTCTDIATV